MPAEGDGAPRTQSVQEQVQGAMAVMQDNMRAMAERDSQMNQFLRFAESKCAFGMFGVIVYCVLVFVVDLYL